jgi:glutathione S-transferase
MTVKLHRCDNEWVRCSGHPCWNVQQALDRAGIEYEIVEHPSFPRHDRTKFIALAGTSMLPAIELEDGTILCQDSKDLVAMIEAGRIAA